MLNAPRILPVDNEQPDFSDRLHYYRCFTLCSLLIFICLYTYHPSGSDTSRLIALLRCSTRHSYPDRPVDIHDGPFPRCELIPLRPPLRPPNLVTPADISTDGTHSPHRPYTIALGHCICTMVPVHPWSRIAARAAPAYRPCGAQA